MYNIYYIGAQNSERIDFCQWPYMVTGGNLFDGEFDAIEDDDRIQGWERKITSKKLNIEIHAVGVSLEQAIDQLENVAEKDVLNTTPGRLYVGSSYMKGWLVGTTKDRWLQDLDSISNELIFKSDYPYWITEEEFHFYKQGSGNAEKMEWLEFPYNFPYEFSKVRNLQYINNSNYTASGFKMIIYGPCINPLIRIAGHIYELRTTLYEGAPVIRKIVDVTGRGRVSISYKLKGEE